MPSAAAVKVEKQASSEAQEPFRQAFVVVEHKIRNLEKRKRKIEQYQEEQKNGKTLNSDQLSAVAKVDEVTCTLEYLHDIIKQFTAIAVEQAKVQKRLARKDALERTQQDVSKIKEILIVQDVLQNMGQDNVREDFLAGRNGAIQLTEEDLKYLDDLYLEISLKRGLEDGLPPFQEQLQQCAEHLLSVAEGKVKDIVGTTYAKLKELIGVIQSCGYFDRVSEEPTTQPQVDEGTVPVLVAVAEDEEAEEEEDEPEAYALQEQMTVPQPDTTFPTGLLPQQQTVPTPLPVAAVESSFFTTVAVPVAFANSQPQLQPAPLNEFITPGGIDFIQDSELDPSDMAMLGGASVPERLVATPPPAATPMPVAPIPTQTFTNQSFTATPKEETTEEPQSAADQGPAAESGGGEGWSRLEGEAGDWNSTPQQGDGWNQPGDTQGDWSQQSDNPGDWAPDQANTSDWSAQPSDQGDGYVTQGGSRNYGARGGRGNRGGRGSGPPGGGYSGSRGRGNYQNGRGGGNYGYRNSEGNSYYQQNGYQQRDGYGGGGGYKRGGGGGSRGGAPRGGERGGPRGGAGGRGANQRAGRGGGGYARGNRQ